MLKIKRRNFLHGGVAFVAAPWTTILQIGCSPNHVQNKNTDKGNTMKIHYLEIVTPDVDASVALCSRIHGVSFGVAEKNLGGARTAKLANGGTLGIRAPLRDTETPVVRPYFLVHDIVQAVAAAAQSGRKNRNAAN